MSRKHYTAIARLLAELPDTTAKRQLVLELVLMFKADNERFSAIKFLQTALETPKFNLNGDLEI